MPLITPWMLQEQFQVDWVKLVPLLMASPLKDWRMEQLGKYVFFFSFSLAAPLVHL